MVGKIHPSLASVIFAVFFIFCLAQTSRSQQIQNLKVNKVADEITVSFDLKAADNPQELYEIGIFSSHDEYSKALELKSGKLKDVFPGLGLKYVIDAKKVFTGFQGEVDFKVVATLVYVPLVLVTPVDPLKTKVGKEVTILWKGGGEGSNYRLDYSKEGGAWTPIEESINDTRYTWNIPKKMPKGTYSVKLTSDNTKSKAVYSGNIVIKKKTSPFVFIIPVAAAGAAWYFLMGPGAGEEGGGTVTPTDNNLPGPPPAP